MTEATGAPDVDGIAQPVVRLDVHDQEGITEEGRTLAPRGCGVREESLEGHQLRGSDEIAVKTQPKDFSSGRCHRRQRRQQRDDGRGEWATRTRRSR